MVYGSPVLFFLLLLVVVVSTVSVTSLSMSHPPFDDRGGLYVDVDSSLDLPDPLGEDCAHSHPFHHSPLIGRMVVDRQFESLWAKNGTAFPFDLKRFLVDSYLTFLERERNRCASGDALHVEIPIESIRLTNVGKEEEDEDASVNDNVSTGVNVGVSYGPDCEALRALYLSTNGPTSWTSKDGWDTPDFMTNCCNQASSWSITCDSLGHVTLLYVILPVHCYSLTLSWGCESLFS